MGDGERPAPGSGRGPSLCGGPVYPQLVAPGVDIATTDLFVLTTTQTGTSVAAPYASGALALLLGRFPGTSAERQEAALTTTAADLGPRGPDQRFGYGRLDVAAAATWLATAPDVTIVPARWSAAVRAGGSTTVRLAVRGLHGFAGTVALSARAGLAGARVRTARSVRAGAGAGTAVRVAITVPRRTRSGTYPLTIGARNGRLMRSVTLGLVVRGRTASSASP